PATGLDGTGRYLVNLCSVSRLPRAFERVLCLPRELLPWNVPQRVRPRIAEGAVVGEDLDVVVAVPAAGLERREQPRQTCGAAAGKHTVGPLGGRVTPVGDMDADEAADVPSDLVEDIWRVPQMPRVELDAERGMVGVVEQLDRVAERRDHRPVLPADAVDRLEADAPAPTFRLVADPP